MHTKRVTLCIIVLFFTIMVLLTMTVRMLHTASLPKVTVGLLQNEQFARMERNDNGSDIANALALGLPKQLYKDGAIFVVSSEVINGEERSIARLVTNLELGRENSTSYEILEGIDMLQSVILSSDKVLKDGDEVFVQKE